MHSAIAYHVDGIKFPSVVPGHACFTWSDAQNLDLNHFYVKVVEKIPSSIVFMP